MSVALRVAGALEAAGVDYLVGGSMASSMAGEPRTTLDIDRDYLREGASAFGVSELLERALREAETAG